MLNEIMLNRMKSKQKVNKLKLSPKKIILYVVVTLTVVIITLYLFNMALKSNELRDIANHQQQIGAIQKSFNNINEGWVDDEYCTGYGSDITRNDSKTCYLVLSLNYSPTLDTFNEYLDLLKESYGFTQLRPIETVPGSLGSDDKIRVSSMSTPFGNDISCKFADAAYSLGKSDGYYFVCSFKASDYYFERRNG